MESAELNSIILVFLTCFLALFIISVNA